MTIYRQLIEKIEEKNKFEEGDILDYDKEDYEALPITKNNFKLLQGVSGKKIAFIDGGNSTLIQTPSYCVHFVRVFGAVFQDDKKIEKKKYECFVLAAKNKVDFFWEGEGLANVNISGEIEAAGEIARKHFELQLAEQFTEKSDLVLLDGTLEAVTKEEQRLFSNLYLSAEKNNCIVAALAKTCSLTTKNNVSIISLLNYLGNKEIWQCNDVMKINNKMHEAKLSFVKLNKNSRHVFRFEVHGNNEAASWLIGQANDASFPGYPYGMIYADMFARVTNEEKNYFALRFTTQYQKMEQDIFSLNAHSILDTMR